MNVWVHNLSPFAIQFTETFGIRWYGLAYLSGFVLGYLVIRAATLRGNSTLRTDLVADYVTYGAIGVLGGGRLGYCLFYAPELLIRFDSSFPFWGVFKVNEGGMSSHGGILGTLLVCYFYGRKHKVSMLHLMDLAVFAGSIGFTLGRIANFINGELYGRPAPEGFKWAVKFPQEMYLWTQGQVSKLLDVAPAAEALGKLHLPDKDVPIDRQTWIGWVQNFTHDSGSRNAVHQTVEQIIVAIQSGNQKVSDALAPALTARYPSQLYQSFLEGFLVLVALFVIWRKPQKPGILAAWFSILYCVARIIGEQYRMPDAQIGFQLWGLTRGQWLSIALLAVSVFFLIVFMRRNVEPMGGFSRSNVSIPPSKSKKSVKA